MLSTKQQVVSALNQVLPTYYDLYLGDAYSIPCITYTGYGDEEVVHIRDYRSSNVSYYVRLWTKTVADIETYAPQIDEKMRLLGFHRISSSESIVGNMITKVLIYEGRVDEYIGEE